MSGTKVSDQILEIARQILASEGLGAVSFNAIARRLGRSKQAVLYWFPTKQDLLAAMFLPWLEAEAETATNSVVDVVSRSDAIGSFVRAISAFHFDDFNRFRMMYLVPQTIKQSSHETQNAGMVEQVHPVTDRIYGALACHLEGDRLTARREAVAIHSAVLGLVLMFALADGLRDPLKHSESELVDALIASLTVS
jgi:AcrR family transcriptional regulator